ncbi:hypothetical protein F383_06167 [Gossypium arboreum]|uniref:Uncharacterized protein n=1 Tax=Gossypium arboreum TaxID=29729 RepID=A0A0B0PFD8_GOSAR|nr:hypothetical protein F383_06167 [Gossypium arboreum]
MSKESSLILPRRRGQLSPSSLMDANVRTR